MPGSKCLNYNLTKVNLTSSPSKHLFSVGQSGIQHRSGMLDRSGPFGPVRTVWTGPDCLDRSGPFGPVRTVWTGPDCLDRSGLFGPVRTVWTGPDCLDRFRPFGPLRTAVQGWTGPAVRGPPVWRTGPVQFFGPVRGGQHHYKNQWWG